MSVELLTAVEILLFDLGTMADETGRCPVCDCEGEIGHTSDCSADALERALAAAKGKAPRSGLAGDIAAALKVEIGEIWEVADA